MNFQKIIFYAALAIFVFAGFGANAESADAPGTPEFTAPANNATTTVSAEVVVAVAENKNDLLPIPDVLAKKAECMKGNWGREDIAGGPFKNQGECVAHWNHQIRRHIENIINTIRARMQEMVAQVKKQNDEAVSKGYANWGQYMKDQKAHQKGN